MLLMVYKGFSISMLREAREAMVVPMVHCSVSKLVTVSALVRLGAEPCHEHLG